MKRLLLGTCLLTSSFVSASDGRIPIYQPTTITEPGHYYLTNDIQADMDEDAITIDAVGVTLDLNRYGIETSGIGKCVVITFDGNDVIVRNGRLTGGNYGIFAGEQFHDPPLRVRVEGVEVHDLAGPSDNGGMLLTGLGRVELHDNRIFRTRYGIDLRGSNITGSVTRNLIRDVPAWGLVSGGAGVQFRHNIVVDHCYNAATMAPGISVGGEGNLTEENVVIGDGTCCGLIEAGNHSIVRDNLLPNTGGLSGLRVTGDGNMIWGNAVSGGGGDGITVYGDLILPTTRNLILGNLVHGYPSAGLRFTAEGVSAQAYRDNMLRDNGSAVVIEAGGAATATDEGGNILP